MPWACTDEMCCMCIAEPLGSSRQIAGRSIEPARSQGASFLLQHHHMALALVAMACTLRREVSFVVASSCHSLMLPKLARACPRPFPCIWWFRSRQTSVLIVHCCRMRDFWSKAIDKTITFSTNNPLISIPLVLTFNFFFFMSPAVATCVAFGKTALFTGCCFCLALA